MEERVTWPSDTCIDHLWPGCKPDDMAVSIFRIVSFIRRPDNVPVIEPWTFELVGGPLTVGVDLKDNSSAMYARTIVMNRPGVVIWSTRVGAPWRYGADEKK